MTNHIDHDFDKRGHAEDDDRKARHGDANPGAADQGEQEEYAEDDESAWVKPHKHLPEPDYREKVPAWAWLD